MRNPRGMISSAVLIACTLFFGFFIRDHYAEFSGVFSEISVAYLLLIACASLGMIAVAGLFLKVLIAEFKIDLGFWEYFSLTGLTCFGNIFLPMKGGVGFKALYLKRKYNFDYSNFVASLAANYLVGFNLTSATALLGMLGYYMYAGYWSIPLAAVFLTLLAGTSWAIFIPPRRLDWIPFTWVRRKTNEVLDGWHLVRRSGGTVFRLYGILFLYTALTSAITWLEFAAFGMKDISGNPIGLAQSIVFTAIASLSVFVGITPAALGIRESLLMFCSQTLGISPAQALAVSLLDRAISFIVLALISAFASIYIRKQMSEKPPVI